MAFTCFIFSHEEIYIFSVSCFNVFGDFIWRFSSPTNNAGFIGKYISCLDLLFIQWLNICPSYLILACHRDNVNMKVDYGWTGTIYCAEFYCFLGPFNQLVWYYVLHYCFLFPLPLYAISLKFWYIYNLLSFVHLCV